MIAKERVTTFLKRYSMPAAPRMNKKANRICWELIGQPAPFRFRPNKKEKAVDKRLLFEETTRAR